METKKILTISFSMLAVCVLAFVGIWLAINWDNIKKGLSGTALYTSNDLANAKEEGYNNALADVEELTEQVEAYKNSINQYQRLIIELQANNNDYKLKNAELTTDVNNLLSTNDFLTNNIENLEEQLAYYEEIISQYETENIAIVIYKMNGTAYKVEEIEKGQTINETTPTLEYHTFNNWTIGDNVVEMPYTVNQSIIINANFTRMNVDFIDGISFRNLICENYQNISGVVFDYYSSNEDVYLVDNLDVINNVNSISICDNKVKLYYLNNVLYVLSHYNIRLNSNSSNMFNNSQLDYYINNLNTPHLNPYFEELHLTSVIFRNVDTSLVTDMSNMFGYCDSLTILDLSKFVTINVTDMPYMFHLCESLTSLNISSFNTANVTTMDSMFRDCHSLIELDLSNFNTANVTTMDSMFRNCKSLTSLNISSFNTTNVTSMSYMFASCESLTSLNISSFNTTNVTDMHAMFKKCKTIRSLDLSNFNTSNVENMREMFSECEVLKTIYVATFDTSKLAYNDINDWFSDPMFKKCFELVGGNGTIYSSDHSYKDYARIDTSQTPGYFTYKAIN